jgi:sorting and assembly machinery component 37
MVCLWQLSFQFNFLWFKQGQLPFLVHEERIIPTFALIAKYVAGLKDFGTSTNLDASLNNTDQSRKVAWCAHVESNLGDLVVIPHLRYVSQCYSLVLKYHTLYSHHGNWTGLTQPMLASALPVPQCYYVPGRMRERHRARLEAAGLWSFIDVEKQGKKSFRETLKSTKEKADSHIYLQAFQREKVCKCLFSPGHLNT